MAATASVPIENTEQAKAWDGDEGALWARYPEFFDGAIRLHHARLMEAAAIKPDDRILDIGCGTGQTTRDAARAATNGHVTGIDLSEAMLQRAREIATAEGISNTTFIRGDAQSYPFDNGAFTAAISRTGTMFFGDQVRAFSNIARALQPGAPLTIGSWRGIEHNEWLRTFVAVLAAGRQMPTPPPDAPGPFAHGDRERVTGILRNAGFTDITFDAHDAPMYFGTTPTNGFDIMRQQLGWMVRDLDEPNRTAALDALRASLEEHHTPDGVAYGSSMWIIRARTAS